MSTSPQLPAPIWHRKDGGPYHRLGLSIVIMRDPDSGWINASIYRVQVHTRNKVTIQFDHPGRHGAIIAQEILGPRQALPGRRGQRRGPGAVHRRLRISAGGPVGIRLRRRHQGRADRGDGRSGDRPAAAGAGRDHPRRRAAAAERGDAAGRSVRRVHRLLRRRRAALPGDGGHGDPSPRRSDPARLAADEAAALPFRPAVPRRLHLEQSRDGRRHRRGRRLAARRATDDRGGAQAALRRPRQARRR